MKWNTRIAHIRRARDRKGAGSNRTREREAGAAAAGGGLVAPAGRGQPGAGRRPAPILERGTQRWLLDRLHPRGARSIRAGRGRLLVGASIPFPCWLVRRRVILVPQIHTH